MNDSLKNIWKDKGSRQGFILFCMAGILLRLIFMPISLHKDLLWINMFAAKMPYLGVFNIYGFIQEHFYTQVVVAGASYYGPLAYFLFGGVHAILKLAAPGLGGWLLQYSGMVASGDYSGYLGLLKMPESLGYITLMKLPYLVFDALCAFLLLAYCESPKSSLRAFKLWMINPVVIFGSYIFGQLDILIAFLLLLALILIIKGKRHLGMFVIGCSVLVKASPLILIVPLGILSARGWRDSLKLMLIASAPVILVITPLYLMTGNYALSAVFPRFIANAGASKIDTLEFLIGKFIFIIGYLVLICKLVLGKHRRELAPGSSLNYSLSVLLLSFFIIFTPVHYFQWVVPLLIIAVAREDIPLWVYVCQMSFLFIYAINSRPLGAQLFLPVNPEYLYSLKSLPEFMNQILRWGVVMRLARLMFDACIFYIIWRLIFKPEVKSA